MDDNDDIEQLLAKERAKFRRLLRQLFLTITVVLSSVYAMDRATEYAKKNRGFLGQSVLTVAFVGGLMCVCWVAFGGDEK